MGLFSKKKEEATSLPEPPLPPQQLQTRTFPVLEPNPLPEFPTLESLPLEQQHNVEQVHEELPPFDLDLELEDIPHPELQQQETTQAMSFSFEDHDPQQSTGPTLESIQEEKLLLPPHEHFSTEGVQEKQKQSSPTIRDEASIPTPTVEEKIPDTLPDLDIPRQEQETVILPKGPLFIRVADYKTSFEDLLLSKAQFAEYPHFTQHVNDTIITKEKTYEKWRVLLEEIERKLVYIDKTVFEEV